MKNKFTSEYLKLGRVVKTASDKFYIVSWNNKYVDLSNGDVVSIPSYDNQGITKGLAFIDLDVDVVYENWQCHRTVYINQPGLLLNHQKENEQYTKLIKEREVLKQKLEDINKQADTLYYKHLKED